MQINKVVISGTVVLLNTYQNYSNVFNENELCMKFDALDENISPSF